MKEHDTDPTVCRVSDCDRPSDGYFVCKMHAEELTKTLETLPWLLTELDIVVALQTRYTMKDGNGGGTSAPMDFVAADIKRELISAVVNAGGRIAHVNGWIMPGNATDAAAVLHYRITAVRLYPGAGTLVDRINRAVRSAVFVIDRPVSRQYLGDCEALKPKVEPCPGRVYGREWRTWASCDTCGLKWDQRELKAYLLAALADRLCTAAEIAHLSTYMGLTITRDQIRKRLNQWHKRGTLPSAGSRDGAPVFRFATAEILLARYSQT